MDDVFGLNGFPIRRNRKRKIRKHTSRSLFENDEYSGYNKYNRPLDHPQLCSTTSELNTADHETRLMHHQVSMPAITTFESGLERRLLPDPLRSLRDNLLSCIDNVPIPVSSYFECARICFHKSQICIKRLARTTDNAAIWENCQSRSVHTRRNNHRSRGN